MTPLGRVFVVDDDPSVRASMTDLLSAEGYAVEAFPSATAYVDSTHRPGEPACLVLDVHLPDINGLDLQRELARGRHPPIIFISGNGDIPSTVKAMKAGALDFLPKPFAADRLLDAVAAALENHRLQLKTQADDDVLASRRNTLTPREREVFGLVVTGLLNKQTAARLGISEVTLQIHRRQVMRKMQAGSFADLVRMASRLRMVGDANTGKDGR